jgi:phosphomannomutase
MGENIRFIDISWVGTFAADFTLRQVRQRGHHLGSVLQAQGGTCLVAYDSRFMSNLFARDLCRTLETQGITVHLASGAVPLPAIYNALSQGRANVGLVVSARNRPYWYNGLVLLKPASSDLSLVPEEASSETERDMLPFPLTSPASSQPDTTRTTLDLRALYIENLLNHIDVEIIRRSTMTIFVDLIHGTTGGYLPAIIGEESQSMAIEINREIDPLFNKFTPLPTATHLNRLRKLVRESDSHLGLAFSADGTALGVVDKNGEHVEKLEVVLLLAAYLSRQYRQKGLIIAPPAPDIGEVITMSGLESWQEAVGLTLDVTDQANERIAETLNQDPASLLIGCTREGELVLGHYHPYPDALLAALLIIEMVVRGGGNLRTLLDELRTRIT